MVQIKQETMLYKHNDQELFVKNLISLFCRMFRTAEKNIKTSSHFNAHVFDVSRLVML